MTGMMIALLAHLACGAAPTEAELAEAQNWVAAKFGGIAETTAVKGNSLEVVANNDAVQPNARGGKPMKIADRQYTRGLYCHAVSKVIVRLLKPARQLEAVAGVDSNDQTGGGRGSVVFSVNAGGKTLWQSELLHEGMPGVPVALALGGTSEFVLEVSDGGDGIGCDQADWADARVTLEDGSVLWLGDLPQVNHQRAPYASAPFFAFTYDGKPSSEFLGAWPLERTSAKLDGHRERAGARDT